MKKLYVLLLAIPVAIIAEITHASPVLVFGAAALGLIPLAEILGEATEELAVYAGPRVGGLLNATLGNAAELIIAGFALRAGLLDLVKASITGSILGNLLLVLGLSLFFGGLRHGTQRFNREQAGISATMMVLSVVALGVPTMYARLVTVRNAGPVESLSEAVAVVMIATYLLALYFSLFWDQSEQAIAGVHHETAKWSKRFAMGMLAITTAAIIVLSEMLVGAVEPVVAELGVSEFFLGIVIIPLIGNVAEHLVGVTVAWKNRMDLSLAVSLGSSMQVAMLVGPVLVFISLLVGHPMDLVFTDIEIAALGAASIVAALVALDGESNWMEGVMLLAVYLLLALAFLWWPAV